MVPKLHDAVLEAIEVDWLGREVVLRFRSSGGAVVAVVRSVSDMQIPRSEPWGPSVVVNGVEVLSLAETTEQVKVEMQSGDVLVFEGAEVLWSTPAA